MPLPCYRRRVLILAVLTTDPAVGYATLEEVDEIVGHAPIAVRIVSLYGSAALPAADGHVAVSAPGPARGGRAGSPGGLARIHSTRAASRRFADQLIDRSRLGTVVARASAAVGPTDTRRTRVASPVAARFWRRIVRSPAALELLGSADAVAAREESAAYAAWRVARRRPDVVATLGVGPAVEQLAARADEAAR